MWFRTLFDSLNRRSTSQPKRRAKRAAGCRRESRRLFLEGLEDRSLLTFIAPVDYDVGTRPPAVVSGYFNNDAALDLAVANYWDFTVSVLLGNVDGGGNPLGTFQAAVPYATGRGPLSLAVGDLDGDGILDLATANAYGSYGDVSVLLGTDDGAGAGTGAFQAPTSTNIAGSIPSSVAVGDFDGDDLMDLGVVSNYCYYDCYGYAHVLVGDGTGNFSGQNTTPIGYGDFPFATAANLDGAGADELVTVNSQYGYYYGTVNILVGDGSGFLQLSTTLYTGTDALGVAVGYVNGDNAADIVTANGYNDSVSVLLADGLGGFGAAQTFAAGSYPASVVLGDFTGDGDIDIATANYYGDDVSVLYGGGDGTFSTPALSATGSYPRAIAAGDFDGDTWLDAATANLGGNNVSVLINDETWPDPPPPPPSIEISDAVIVAEESGLAAVFTVTVVGDPTGVSVAFSTADGAARAGRDYEAMSDTLSFGPGVSERTISVPILDDTLDEDDVEQFYVSLFSATGGLIADSQGIGTIQDDDLPPGIIINDVSKNEGANRSTMSFVFTVSLLAASGKDVYVNFATANGTATTADSDYIATSGSVHFDPGQTTATVTVVVRGDKRRELNETFFVNLSDATNGTISDSQGVGTIVNDESGGKGKHSSSLIAALLAGDALTTNRKRK